MSIEHVLAVVPVADFKTSRAWYERLFDASPTNIPMPGSLAEWRVTDVGWVQMTVDAERAGSGLLNFAVPDLDEHLRDLAGRGIPGDDIQTASKGVRLSSVRDPDGNVITFIGGFRVDY